MRPFLSGNARMLIWQVTMFALVWAPLTWLIFWILSADGTVQLIFAGIIGATLLGLFLTRGRTIRLPDHIKPPALLRPPAEYRLFQQLGFMTGNYGTLLAIALLRDESALSGISAVGALYAVSNGFGWVGWSLGGLRFRPQPPEGPAESTEIVLVLEPTDGRGSGSHAANWSVAEGATVREAVTDILRSRFLPDIPGGERRWRVAVDGEAVAAVSQSWTGPEWWPEPEWLADPDTPFAGRRIEFSPATENAAG